MFLQQVKLSDMHILLLKSNQRFGGSNVQNIQRYRKYKLFSNLT